MAEAIKTESRGRMEIQIFPNSQLGSNAAMIEQVRLGSIQFFQSANPDYGTVVPVAQIDSIAMLFSSREQGLDTLDGQLGAYIRTQFAAKGMHAFEKASSLGFRHVINSIRPVRTADDCAGLKLRAAPAPISVEFWKTLGVTPVNLPTTEVYPALTTKLVDGMETPLSSIEAFKWNEPTKYLSTTAHTFNGAWIVANAEAFNALPLDLQTVVSRNMQKAALGMRADFVALDRAAPDRLRAKGMVVNAVDAAGIRSRLSTYYARWKNEFGATVWSLLEAKVGKLG
jgi:tripartite ATP-independent transporter DctP family solute receptor